MSTFPIAPYYLPREAAAAYCGLSVSTFEEEVRAKRLPQPRQLSQRRVGWALPDLQAWCEARPVSDMLPPPNTGAKKPRATASKPAPQDASTAS